MLLGLNELIVAELVLRAFEGLVRRLSKSPRRIVSLQLPTTSALCVVFNALHNASTVDLHPLGDASNYHSPAARPKQSGLALLLRKESL